MSDSSMAGPKMMAWSSTKEEMSGPGTLRVGAKTMPTENSVSYRNRDQGYGEGTYHCGRSSC
jgi:hypothetical protein